MSCLCCVVFVLACVQWCPMRVVLCLCLFACSGVRRVLCCVYLRVVVSDACCVVLVCV
jgi:hypothetical protein